MACRGSGVRVPSAPPRSHVAGRFLTEETAFVVCGRVPVAPSVGRRASGATDAVEEVLDGREDASVERREVGLGLRG